MKEQRYILLNKDVKNMQSGLQSIIIFQSENIFHFKCQNILEKVKVILES